MSVPGPPVTPEPNLDHTSSGSATRIVAAVLISASLLGFVVSQIDLDDALDRLGNAHLGWLLGSFLMIAVVMVLRGLRFWIVTERSRSRVVIAAVFLQNFFNRIMPFRLGELSLPYLLKKAENEPVAPTVISLLLVRILELWTVLVMVVVALWFYLGGQTEDTFRLLIAGGLVSVLLLGYQWFLALGVRVARWVISATGLERSLKILSLMEQLEAAVVERGRLSWSRYATLWLMTILVVVLNQLAFDFLVRSLGYDLNFLQIIVGVSATQILGALPLPTVGSVGTHEAGWVVGFMLVGMAQADAMLTGVASQVLSLLFNGILAAPAYLYLLRFSAGSDPD